MSYADFNDIALSRLFRLASPALPVGGYSYSQGLEWAVEEGLVQDEASSSKWITNVLCHSIGRFEAPIWWRLYHSWKTDDMDTVACWNELFLTGRETAEFRAETLQMGYSLKQLLLELNEFGDNIVRLLQLNEPTYPAVFSFAASAWGILPRAALMAYLWAWVENQVISVMKTVPLGQVAGQQILSELLMTLPTVLERAISLHDSELSNFAPALAIASSRHETQYSRLFRS